MLINNHRSGNNSRYSTHSVDLLKVPTITFGPFPSPSAALEQFNLPLLIPSPPPSPDTAPENYESENEILFDDLELTKIPTAIWRGPDWGGWDSDRRMRDDADIDDGDFEKLERRRTITPTMKAMLSSEESTSQCPTPRPMSAIATQTATPSQTSEIDDTLSPLPETFVTRSRRGSRHFPSSSSGSAVSSTVYKPPDSGTWLRPQQSSASYISTETSGKGISAGLNIRVGQSRSPGPQPLSPGYGHGNQVGRSWPVSCFIGEDELMEGLARSL
ncbi:hypothetical protein P154DRAFT_606857 [Amniculicola lignicola CBS 123094]|uniref:Uncharacterized protein n=1 Tax=Amniculicola lignicola CBS 123094 TaxID=1392246 RepID=A0A6A5W8H6_9PLEO|nr:hypothetical protein P154DRAFT_606857 [Amniculicola lignicola CBS 123094]